MGRKTVERLESGTGPASRTAGAETRPKTSEGLRTSQFHLRSLFRRQNRFDTLSMGFHQLLPGFIQGLHAFLKIPVGSLQLFLLFVGQSQRIAPSGRFHAKIAGGVIIRSLSERGLSQPSRQASQYHHPAEPIHAALHRFTPFRREEPPLLP
jgi:hypothetical protein